MEYLKKIISILFVTLILCVLAGQWLDKRFKKAMRYEFTTLDECINGNKNYDIVFFGDSRVQTGINPYYIDSITKLSSYNFGMGGTELDEIYLMNLLYLKKHKAPAFMVLSFDEGKIYNAFYQLPYRNNFLFYPYNDTVSAYLDKNGFYAGMVRWFPFTKYCYFDDYQRTLIFNQPDSVRMFAHNVYKGFLNRHDELRSGAINLWKAKPTLNQIPLARPDEMMTVLKNILNLYKDKETIIVFSHPPLHPTAARNMQQLRQIEEEICKHYKVRIFDFIDTHEISDLFFHDQVHLNEPGSRIYSRMLADSINSLR